MWWKLAVIVAILIQDSFSINNDTITKRYHYTPGPASGTSSLHFPSTSMVSPKDLESLYEWEELEFEFPSNEDKMNAILHKLYVPGNGNPIDVDVHYGAGNICRVFVTVPRFVTGIPVTLATVSDFKGPKGPILKPYPNYAVQASHGNDCNGITSVFRVEIDECNRLWVIDSGRIGSNQLCPPQILVYNLQTDTLMHRYRIPESQYTPGVSLFVTPIVDVLDPPPRGLCHKTMVYVADVSAFGVLVYDAFENKSWRVQNKLMYPYPDYGTFNLAGESFDLMDGVIGMAISPKNVQNRFLFFHSLAGSKESVVPLRLLNNESIWINNSDAMPRSFRNIGDRKIQAVAEAIDSKGNMFFGVMDPIAIVSWNIRNPYDVNNIKIVSQNDKTLQFASGVKVRKHPDGREELWVSTCRFQKIMTGTKNSNEINFRIQRCFTDDLLSGRSSCGSGICRGVKQNHNEPLHHFPGGYGQNLIFS